MLYRNLKLLVFIYKKPRSFNEMCHYIDVEPEALSHLPSMKEMEGLYSASDSNCFKAEYRTTFLGETIARSEMDRIREVWFTRILAIISLIISILALGS